MASESTDKPRLRGMSGNRVWLARIASQYSERAIQILAEIMEDTDASRSDRAKAANMILDRAHGKPIAPAPDPDDGDTGGLDDPDPAV